MRITKKFIEKLQPHKYNLCETNRYIYSERSFLYTIVNLKSKIEAWDYLADSIILNNSWKNYIIKTIKSVEKIGNYYYLWGSEFVFSKLVPQDVIYGYSTCEYIPEDPSIKIAKIKAILLTKNEAIIKDIIQ
jgi:hypothetical protein